MNYNIEYTLYFISKKGWRLIVTHSGIEAFLAICRAKSITRAAESLFICQSSLSVRLKTLESELGTTLFSRHKGQREIILTQSGKEFYDIALEYEKTINKIEQLRRINHKKLRVSSLNSLGSYILPESYELFITNHPDVELIIQDYEFDEACKNILHGTTDIAFNTDNNVSDRISAMPIFSEPFTVISSENSSYPKTVSRDMLSVKNEVYVDWFNGFENWHSATFGTDVFPQIRLNIMSQLKLFAEKKENWAIVPVSVALGLEKSTKIRRLKTTFELPERIVYCLFSAEKSLDGYPLVFLECLNQILSERSEVKSLLKLPVLN